MAYRTFKDSRGTEWQAWDVIPRLAERRIADRRAPVDHPAHSERRTQMDRRIIQGVRPTLKTGIQGGWLCFEAPDEKRRLTPIPADWDTCEQHQLERYCDEATRAVRASVVLHNRV